ncbi:ATP synthase subunit d, mitochondrial-like [Tubulanus polymorphus]|uniref:ATP synthase subunit d, mitochondrial-like n=1 Tax=Tubulanus polymorphus TaxID=672921 RepID=UPI003DA592A8
MASKRIAKSAVDWVKFAEKVPKSQTDYFRAFKAKSDHFVMKVHAHPESIQAIDFSFYKNKIHAAGLVAEFEKAFAGLKVPYPADKNNMMAEIDKQEKEAEVRTQEFTKMLREKIGEAKTHLAEYDLIPPVNELTMEHIVEYFPHAVPQPETNPTLWPHNPKSQPATNPNLIL